MRFSPMFSVLVVPVFLTACAQPETPAPIQGEMLFDKMGNAVGCVEGVFIPGAAEQYQCYVPDDECDPAFANDPDCLPQQRQDDPNRVPVNPNRPVVGAGGP